MECEITNAKKKNKTEKGSRECWVVGGSTILNKVVSKVLMERVTFKKDPKR